MKSQRDRRAVLLLNMGGPNNIDEVELFLRNMFADPNILPMNRFMRRYIGDMIVKKRLNEAEENYREIGGKSPLRDITDSLCKKVEALCNMPVRPAMRYVPPFADKALEEFKDLGIDELILFPMYPQYSTTTTLSSYQGILEKCKKLNYNPSIKLINSYYDSYDYIAIQYEKIMETLGSRDPEKFNLILSAHGLPLSIIKSGDPYEKQVEANVSALRIYLKERGINFKNIILAYQSKVGSAAWLEPNLVDILRKPDNLNILISPIAFTVDNSETIFELDIEHRVIAEKIGYSEYLVAPCPNDDDSFANFIAKSIELCPIEAKNSIF